MGALYSQGARLHEPGLAGNPGYKTRVAWYLKPIYLTRAGYCARRIHSMLACFWFFF